MARRLALPAVLFLISQTVPWIILIGTVRLSFYRIVLIAWVMPCLLMWARGQAGRRHVGDFALLFFCFWSAISIVMVHGVSYAVQPAAILFVETMGAYLLGRCFIRSAEDFVAMIRFLFAMAVVLLPFAIIEAVSGRNIAQELLATIGNISDSTWELDTRWGMQRAKTVFEHPILFGVVCGSILGLVHAVLGSGRGVLGRWTRSGLVLATAFFSLSSGPFTVLAIQIALLGWDAVLRHQPHRWRLLGGLLAGLYLAITLLSNQSVFEFYIYYFAFSGETGWDRIMIWRYGWASVLDHFWFGIGFNEYRRAEWMSPSIDMFWLVNAVQFGAVPGLLMLLAFFSTLTAVGRARGLDGISSDCRKGFMITMIAFFAAGWAVHFWNVAYVLFMFLLGSGAWIADAAGTAKVPVNRRTPLRPKEARAARPSRLARVGGRLSGGPQGTA